MRSRGIVWVLLVVGLHLFLASRPALCQWEHVGPDSGLARCAIFRAGDADTAYAAIDFCQQPGVYRSLDGGTTWNRTAAPFLDLRTLGVDPVDKGYIYLVCQTKVYKSMDGGDTWQEKDRGIALDIGDQYLHDIAINPCHSETVYVTVIDFGSSGEMFRTANGGERWVLADMPARRAVAIDPLNCGRMYTAMGWGSGPVYRSLNSGTTWQGVLPKPADDIAINPQSPDTIYLAVEGIVYRSIDGGDTWNSFGPETGLAGYVDRVTVNPVNPLVVYACGQGGIYRSTDGGITWSDFSEGLPQSIEVFSVAVDGETGQTLLIGTFEYGLFRRTESLADIEPPLGNRETSILALQVSPNPFRGGTGISYRLPAPAVATLSVYDVTGRLVNRLASGHRPAGCSTAAWNGKDTLGSIVAPGIYFLELTTTTDRKTRTIVLFK